MQNWSQFEVNWNLDFLQFNIQFPPGAKLNGVCSEYYVYFSHRLSFLPIGAKKLTSCHPYPDMSTSQSAQKQ